MATLMPNRVEKISQMTDVTEERQLTLRRRADESLGKLCVAFSAQTACRIMLQLELN